MNQAAVIGCCNLPRLGNAARTICAFQLVESTTMRILFFIIAMLAIAWSGLAFLSARSALHEIAAMVLGLIGLVSLIGAALLEAVNRLRSEQPTEETHVKCPDCRELVLRDARKCKHCGCSLVPQ